MKKKLLKQIAKHLLKNKSNDEQTSRDQDDAIDEVLELLEKLGKLDAIKDLRERMKHEKSKQGSFDDLGDTTNGNIQHDVSWFKDRDERRAKRSKAKRQSKKKAHKTDADRAAAAQESRRRDEERDRELREDAEAKARAIKIVEAEHLSLQNLMNTDLDALFEDTGSSDLNTVFHAKDASGQHYASVDALCMDHPKFMKHLLRDRNQSTADTLARIIVILHRCGLHPTPDGYETRYNDPRIILLLDLGERLHLTGGIPSKAPIDTALLLEITCDPGGTCARPLHYPGDPAKIGIARDWEMKGQRFWPSVVLDIVAKGFAVQNDPKVEPILKQLAEKWDSAPHLCGQDVRTARCRIAGLLDEVNVIGSWYTQDVVTDTGLAELMQAVPDEPLLWQVLGQGERHKLFRPGQHVNESNETAFRNRVFDTLTNDATSTRIDTLLAAIRRLESLANTRFKRDRTGRIESSYRLNEIIEWADRMSRQPRRTAKNDPKSAVMEIELDLVVAPAILFKPLPDMMDQSDCDTPATCRLGGQPQLPDDLAWPALPDGRAYHFYAQLDLASLPRNLFGCPKPYDLPTFPKTGTLFVFLPLAGEDHFEYKPTLLFTKDPVAHLPNRRPPENTPLLADKTARYLLPEGICADIVTLRCQNLEVVPFMSARCATKYNPASEIMSETPTELTQSLIDTLLTSSFAAAVNGPSKSKGKPANTAWNSYVESTTQFKADSPYKQFLNGPNRLPLQLFGHGEDVQGSLSFEQAKKGKIMLCQIGNRFGTPLNLVNVSIQAWITPDDLKVGCFERVEWTQNYS